MLYLKFEIPNRQFFEGAVHKLRKAERGGGQEILTIPYEGEGGT